jgi:hypothetical protein
MKSRKSSNDIVRNKANPQRPGGGYDFPAPSAGRYLVKNSDEKTEEDLVEEGLLRLLVREVILSVD